MSVIQQQSDSDVFKWLSDNIPCSASQYSCVVGTTNIYQWYCYMCVRTIPGMNPCPLGLLPSTVMI